MVEARLSFTAASKEDEESSTKPENDASQSPRSPGKSSSGKEVTKQYVDKGKQLPDEPKVEPAKQSTTQAKSETTNVEQATAKPSKSQRT